MNKEQEDYVMKVKDKMKPTFEKTMLVIKCMDELNMWDHVFEGVEEEQRKSWRSRYICDALIIAGMEIELPQPEKK